MSADRSQRRIPDITLEQYLLGELGQRDTIEVERAIATDPETRQRLAELQRSDREILHRYPPTLMSRQVRARLEQRPAVARPWLAFRPALAAAGVGAAAIVAALLLVDLPAGPLSPTPEDPGLSEQIKGEGARLRVHRRTFDGSEVLQNGARAFEGDLLQLSYQAAGHAYGAIVAVDGRGLVTLVLPEVGDRSVALTNNGFIPLDFALELDDAPRWERFYFVTADFPFALSPLLRAAERVDLTSPVEAAEPLDIEGHFEQFIFSLEKGTVRR